MKSITNKTGKNKNYRRPLNAPSPKLECGSSVLLSALVHRALVRSDLWSRKTNIQPGFRLHTLDMF